MQEAGRTGRRGNERAAAIVCILKSTEIEEGTDLRLQALKEADAQREEQQRDVPLLFESIRQRSITHRLGGLHGFCGLLERRGP
jgi:hypothetical protein